MSDKAEMSTIRALQDYRRTILNGDHEARAAALVRFEAVVEFVVPSERRAAYQAARTEMDVVDAERAFQEFGRIVNEHFAPLGDAFRLGQEMADSGRQGLFFPAAAAHLSSIDGILRELSATAEDVKDSIGDFEDAFRAKDATALIDEANRVKVTIEGLLDKLANIREGLPA